MAEWEDLRPDCRTSGTLGYRRLEVEPGRAVIEWEAGAEYAFPVDGRAIPLARCTQIVRAAE